MSVTNQDNTSSVVQNPSASTWFEFFANLGRIISAAFKTVVKAVSEFFVAVSAWIVSAYNTVVKAVGDFISRLFGSSKQNAAVEDKTIVINLAHTVAFPTVETSSELKTNSIFASSDNTEKAEVKEVKDESVPTPGM